MWSTPAARRRWSNSVKAFAARPGAACYADPFLPTTDDTVEESVLSRAMGWLAVAYRPPDGPARDLDRPEQQGGTADARRIERTEAKGETVIIFI